MVTVLFERGAFRHADTLRVAKILFIVLAGDVMLRMVGNIISRTFYVLKDTLTFPLVSAAAVLLYIPLAKILTRAMGYVGLALALPLQLVAGTIIVYVLMAIRLRPFPTRKVAAESGLYLAASLTGAAATWTLTRFLPSLPPVIHLAAAFLGGGAVYIAVLIWKDAEMAASLFEIMGFQTLAHRIRRLRGLEVPVPFPHLAPDGETPDEPSGSAPAGDDLSPVERVEPESAA